MKANNLALALITVGSALVVTDVLAQRPDGQRRPGGPGQREHLQNEAKPLDLLPATEEPPAENQVEIKIEGDSRIISTNNIPDHLTGKFPNAGNPNKISAQDYEFKLPLNPEASAKSTPARKVVGVFLNGVLMESGTGEFWTGGNTRAWNYEALGGAVPFGLDANYAHVQPTGKYHYHGKPTAFLESVNLSAETHSPLVGWAMDGFPVYALYGYSDPEDPSTEIVEMTSSYRLKSGDRPTSPEGPGGKYDGAFTIDYEYVEGLGTLDECNGRFTVTPEFPEGTYAYFLSNSWPVIFRNYRGTPLEEPRGPEQEGGRRGPGGSPPRR
ncbi:MAG: YHYH protein [Luteolibacter sp.]